MDYAVSPDLTLQYDALNQLTNMIDAVGTTKRSYTAVGQLLSEDGPWSNDTLSYTYTNRLRASLSLQQPTASAWTNGYAYDAIKRLTNITSPAGVFGYQYPATGPSPLVARLSLPGGAYITNSYDAVARLLSTQLKNSGGTVLNSHTYGYNLASQRTALTNTAGDYRNYTYDNAGQLKTALAYEADATPRVNEKMGYAYDAAGNLNFRTNNALIQPFTVNSLNELTTVTRSGTLTVAGTTTSTATNVTVNALSAARYGDKTFAKEGFPLVDGTTNFTAIAKDTYGRQDTNTVTVDLRATNTFVYDLNGNLRTNGTEILEYDDENRLVTNYVSAVWKSEFVYDGTSRRRIQRDYGWSGGVWVKTNEARLVYDGNLPLQHRDPNNVPTLTLTRGLDLSGSFQGAGGIGGLLAMTESSGASSYYHNDGSGNVTALINANQLIVGKYSYDSFGRTLSMSGPKAPLSPYRFSSKPQHEPSGHYDFLYRWYIPELQRFANRDPLGEDGGLNLYRNVGNDPVNRVDPLGLWWWDGDYIEWGVGGLLGLKAGPGTAGEAWSGFGEGWSKGGQGVVNAFTGGMFDPEAGLLYDYFDQLDNDAFGSGTKCDDAFKFGNKAGNFAITTLSLAAGPSGRVAAARQGMFKVGTTIAERNAAYSALIGTKQAGVAGRYYSELIARNTFVNGVPVTANAAKLSTRAYDFLTTIKYRAGESEAAINWITGKLTHFIP